MRFVLRLPLLMVLVVAYPYSPYSIEEGNKTVITIDYYPENLVIYEGKHDIVDIMVPLNHASMYDSLETHSAELTQLKAHLMVFFVEADIENGHREDHGIYMYRDGQAIKIMDKGRAVTASADDSDYVFLGAKDGLYVYNSETKSADRHGIFNKSIKDLAKEQKTDVLFILTEDRDLYKVYDTASKELKVDEVKNAEQIMMDYSNHLFYYDTDQKVYVRTVDGKIKEINDIPKDAKEIKLLRPPMFNNEGVGLMVDTEIYTIYPDGRCEAENLEFMPEAKPSAYSMEAAIFRYIGYNKKIYEYDLLSMIDSSESASDLKSDSKVVILI